jgi:S1-C subfamily serine protease
MRLVKVPEDGPAGKAGLKSGDVLIEYGGRKVAQLYLSSLGVRLTGRS